MMGGCGFPPNWCIGVAWRGVLGRRFPGLRGEPPNPLAEPPWGHNPVGALLASGVLDDDPRRWAGTPAGVIPVADKVGAPAVAASKQPAAPVASPELKKKTPLDAQSRQDGQSADRIRNLNGHGYEPKPGDAVLLARLMFAETSNSQDDYAAIGWAIINRVGQKGLGYTLKDVIYKKGEYKGVGNRQWQKAGLPSSLEPDDAASYAKAPKIAADILGNRVSDPTGGAIFFFVGKPDPWFERQIKEGVLQKSPYKSEKFTILRDVR